MNKHLIFLGIAVLLICVGLNGCTEPMNTGPEPNALYFEMDNDARTLTVINVSEEYIGLTWDNLTLNGNGIYPSGTIDIEDTITNCSGEIYIKFIHTSGYPEEYFFNFVDMDEEISKFIGTWFTSVMTAPASYTFYSNGTYIAIPPEGAMYSNTSTGTYEIKSGKLYLSKGSSDGIDYSFSDNNNILTLMGVEYTKQ